jgi:hypothetical protein
MAKGAEYQARACVMSREISEKYISRITVG